MTATMMQPATSTKRIAVFDQTLIPENSLNLLLRELAGERSLAKYFFTRQALITVARLRLHSAKLIWLGR